MQAQVPSPESHEPSCALEPITPNTTLPPTATHAPTAHAPQREALMNAQRQAGGGGGGYPGGSRPPLSKKEQKALKKKQVRSLELAAGRLAGRQQGY